VETRERARWWRNAGEAQLSLLLWAVWDPLGAGVPLDEYENYAGPLFSLLERGESIERIAQELDRFRTESMQSPSDRERDLMVAEKLRAWHYWAVEFELK
jgi:hypothetical protein